MNLKELGGLEKGMNLEWVEKRGKYDDDTLYRILKKINKNF